MKPQRPYKRTDRVGEQILEIITDTAAKNIDLNHLGFITFTGIDVSPDLRSAKIFFSALNPTDDVQNIEKKINSIAKGFKKYLRKEGMNDWEMDMLIDLRRSIQEESK